MAEKYPFNTFHALNTIINYIMPKCFSLKEINTLEKVPTNKAYSWEHTHLTS